MTLRTAAFSDIGLVRPENEDSLLCDDALRLYAVADGIGGLPAGAQASRAAVDTLAGWFHRHPPPVLGRLSGLPRGGEPGGA